MCDCQRTRRDLLTGALGAAALGLAACGTRADHGGGAVTQLPPVASLAGVQVA